MKLGLRPSPSDEIWRWFNLWILAPGIEPGPKIPRFGAGRITTRPRLICIKRLIQIIRGRMVILPALDRGILGFDSRSQNPEIESSSDFITIVVFLRTTQLQV